MKTKAIVLLGLDGSGNAEVAKELSKLVPVPVYTDINTEEKLLQVIDTFGDFNTSIFYISKKSLKPRKSELFFVSMSEEVLNISNDESVKASVSNLLKVLD